MKLHSSGARMCGDRTTALGPGLGGEHYVTAPFRVGRVSSSVLACLELPEATIVIELEAQAGELFLCGGGASGKVRAVRRPKRSAR